MPIIFILSRASFTCSDFLSQKTLSPMSHKCIEMLCAGNRHPNNAAGILDDAACGISGHDVLDVSTHRDSSRSDRILVKLNEHSR
jgi:hypothetical protein